MEKIINILKATQYFSEMLSVRCVLYGEHQLLTLDVSVMSLADVIVRNRSVAGFRKINVAV